MAVIIIMIVFELKDFGILDIRVVDHWCIKWNMSKSDAVKPSRVRDRIFCAHKTPIEVIKDEEFVGTYFRDIYFNVNGRWYKKL